MHNKFSLSVTLNAVKGLKKIPHCVRNDKFFVQFSDLLIYRHKLNIMKIYNPKNRFKYLITMINNDIREPDTAL